MLIIIIENWIQDSRKTLTQDSSQIEVNHMKIDFCKIITLNKIQIGDSYPLPNINDILDSLGTAKYFPVFYLATSFHHIKMDPKDSHETAFSTPHGYYEFDRMPFSLKTAPATFQRSMDLTLTRIIGTELFVYFDDIVINANFYDLK